MADTHGMTIRNASPDDDLTTVKHFHNMWLGMSYPADKLRSDFQQQSLNFISDARETKRYRSFIAEVDGHPVGSVCCQLFMGLYPLVFKESDRKLGYIWCVYVDPEHRSKGIGGQLTQQAVMYLQSMQCTRVVLHASANGKAVYRRLGFVDNNEMKFDISNTLPHIPS